MGVDKTTRGVAPTPRSAIHVVGGRGSVFLDTVYTAPHERRNTVRKPPRKITCTCTWRTSFARVIMFVCCAGAVERGNAGRYVCAIRLVYHIDAANNVGG